MEASEYAPIERGISNMAFLQGLGNALLALTVSAMILLPTFLAFYPHAELSSVEARIISGNELSVIFGRAAKSSTALQLAELSEDGRAILSKRIRFKADDYPFVSYQISGRHPGTVVYLIWRTADKPGEIKNARLYWSGEKTTSINMAKFERWQGDITELGLDIYGDLRGKPLIVENLTVAPYSREALVSTIWSEWTAFQGWDQTSINYLRGTPDNPVLSPTMAMGAWAGLALLLLAATYFFTKAQNIIGYGAVIIIPWMSLDLLWQGELNTQLRETRYLFAGKTQGEKHLAESDSALYQYVLHLKKDVLPEPGVKIFLLNQHVGHSYHRLRAQFHLLPHNVYNYGRMPPQKHIQSGDFILVLGDIRGLEFNPNLNALTWGGNKQPVELVDSQELGMLYRVPALRGPSE